MAIIRRAMSQERVPLFVRLPQEQAAALDRLTQATGRRKQQVVSELLADRLAVGRIDLRDGRSGAAEDVLTLDEVAQLLRVPADEVRARAMQGDLPGRRFGDEWRFVRAAVLAWLAGGHGEPDDGERRDEEHR
jgi:excisionase family DNA binding protein